MIKSEGSDTATARVKGTIFVQVVKTLRSFRQRSESLVPPHLLGYLDRKVLVTDWFPESDYFELMKVIAQLVDSGGVEVWEFMGRTSARVDYEGVYRRFILDKAPADALRGFQILWPLRHDSGEVGIELEGPARATVWLRGYALRAPELLRSIQGTLWQTLQMAGATHIVLQLDTSQPGESRWVATWSDP